MDVIGAVRRIRIIIRNKPVRQTPQDATTLPLLLLSFFCEVFSQIIMIYMHIAE